MADADRIAALERDLAALRAELERRDTASRRVHEASEELFRDTAKALDVIAASLEDLTPEDERGGALDETGIMGRAFELQALVRIFKGNLSDLQQQLSARR